MQVQRFYPGSSVMGINMIKDYLGIFYEYTPLKKNLNILYLHVPVV